MKKAKEDDDDEKDAKDAKDENEKDDKSRYHFPTTTTNQIHSSSRSIPPDTTNRNHGGRLGSLGSLESLADRLHGQTLTRSATRDTRSVSTERETSRQTRTHSSAPRLSWVRIRDDVVSSPSRHIRELDGDCVSGYEFSNTGSNIVTPEERAWITSLPTLHHATPAHDDVVGVDDTTVSSRLASPMLRRLWSQLWKSLGEEEDTLESVIFTALMHAIQSSVDDTRPPAPSPSPSPSPLSESDSHDTRLLTDLYLRLHLALHRDRRRVAACRIRRHEDAALVLSVFEACRPSVLSEWARLNVCTRGSSGWFVFCVQGIRALRILADGRLNDAYAHLYMWQLRCHRLLREVTSHVSDFSPRPTTILFPLFS